MMSSLFQANRRRFLATATGAVAAPMLLAAGTAGAATAPAPVMVDIDSGKLRGLRTDGAVSFKGVPYAAGTGGAHRFLAPRPVPPWTGVRDAFEVGDRSPQSVETMSQVPVFSWYGQKSGFSENCCVLNVYTPDLDRNARRPVLFYIHGGGYVGGGGAGPALDGSNLAKFGDVVVVTVNHRLNVFGYTNLSHLDAERFGDAANAGQLDLVSALNWVKRNISAFGGDPGNVTLFGQSGGGNKIMVLLTMPAARGLFQRAINMSGVTGLQVVRPAATEPYVNELLKALGIDKGNLRKLQEVPVEALLKARAAAMAAARSDGAQPVVDGRHVLASPMTPEGLAMHASVPLMIGVTDTEATLFLRSDMRNFQVTDRQLKARLQAHFRLDEARAEALMAAYRKDGASRSAADILAYLSSDVLARGPLVQAAEAKAKAGAAPVYLYHFDWKIPVDGGVWRSPHAVDIPFAFGTVDQARAMTGDGPGPMEVSRNLMSAFVAFARSGKPDNARMPPWRPYDAVSRPTMVVDESCRLVNDYHANDRIASGPLLGEDPSTFLRGALFRYSE